MSVTNVGPPIYNSTIGSDALTSTKAFVLFNLPTLPANPTVATLYAYTGGDQYGTDLTNLNAYSSNANVSWNESTAYSALDAYSLAQVGSSVTVSSAGWYSWNVLGTASKGVTEAYNLGNGKTTLVLHSTNYSAAAIQIIGAAIYAGRTLLDAITFDDRTMITNPYLALTYSSSVIQVPGVSVHGLMY